MTRPNSDDERPVTAMQKLASESGFVHISEPLSAELVRLARCLSQQVSGEEKKAA